MGRTVVKNSIVTPEKLSQVCEYNITLMNDFLNYLVSIDRSPNTIAAYKNDLKIFFVWNMENNNNKKFIDLRKRDVVKFQAHALTEYQWSTNRLARVKSTLSSLSNYIYNILDDEVEDYRPVIRSVESPVKQTVLEKTILSDEQVELVLNSFVEKGQYKYACLFALACYSGARRAELIQFKVSYFDDCNKMEDTELYRTPETIRTKGRGTVGKELYKYTMTDFKPYFDLWMKQRKDLGIESEWLFFGKDGEQASVYTVNYVADLVSEMLGIPFYFHSLRHYLCTRLFRIGLPADVIQEYFGWSSAEMLKIYNDIKASDTFFKYFTKDGVVGIDSN